MRIILASGSPRRRELLASVGVVFEVVLDATVNEEAELALSGNIEERMIGLAKLKGASVAAKLPDALVLSADTEVLVGGRPCGKPQNALHARSMLKALSAMEHQVVTAVALQCKQTGLLLSGCEATRVFFASLTDEMIDHYVERSAPFDFAGSYAIQGLGALLVTRIEGDYSNVVGLPLGLTARLLEQAGVRVL